MKEVAAPADRQRPRRASIAGPKGSSPRRPIRRVGEEARGPARAWTTKPAAAPSSTASQPEPARGRGRAGAASLTSPMPRPLGEISARTRKTAKSDDGAERRPAADAAQSCVAPPPRAAGGRAAIPRAGNDDPVGQQPVLQVDHAPAARPRRPGTGRRAAPRTARTAGRRARTAAPSRSRRPAAGRRRSRPACACSHGNRPAARFTQMTDRAGPSSPAPTASAVTTGDAEEAAGHGGHLRTAPSVARDRARTSGGQARAAPARPAARPSTAQTPSARSTDHFSRKMQHGGDDGDGQRDRPQRCRGRAARATAPTGRRAGSRRTGCAPRSRRRGSRSRRRPRR